LSARPGFFRVGEATCFGRCSGASPVEQSTGSLPDISGAISTNGRGPTLPFDLSEVVTNLRYERYRVESPHYLEKVTGSSPLRQLYYFLRPGLPVAVRKHLQKIRLSGWDSIAFPQWPVDVTVETLMRTAMELLLKTGRQERIPFIWFWPDGAQSALIVTHDVEGPEGEAFCDRLMDIDESFGVRSAFQIVPEVRYETSKSLADRLRRRGFEVNVHDLNHDGHLFHNRPQFDERAAAINRYAREFESRGFRSGGMYREQDWYDILDVSFDMSVPNVAHLEPQRGGCCTVMPYFIGKLVELPLTTIQDYSLFHILGDYSIDVWRKQIQLILANNGLISILTHPDYLIEERAQKVYVDLLAELTRLRDSGDAWIALPGAVERWWRARNGMTLVANGGAWRIEGPESHRARVAYASLEDGRLVYSLN
jgi:hypothetical protein